VTIGHRLTPDFSIAPLAGIRVSDRDLEELTNRPDSLPARRDGREPGTI